MTFGSCFCGNIRVEYPGQPITSGLCYCTDCRKISGGSNTYTFVVKTADFSVVSGTPKAVPKVADSGNHMKNYFCPDCGTPLFGQKISPNGDPDELTFVRAGIVDDIEALHEQAPQVELYTVQRLKWISPLEGAGQLSGMLANIPRE